MRITGMAIALVAVLAPACFGDDRFGDDKRPAAARTAEVSVEDTVTRVLPSVVLHETYDASGELTGSGSGFIVRSDGWIVTNFHVIEDSARIVVTTMDGRRRWDVAGVGRYHKLADWAVVKVKAVGLPALALSGTADLKPGSAVLAFGNPKGLNGTVSNGIVSHLRNDDGFRMIQHTAAISPGSSGGPLVDRSCPFGKPA